MLAGSSAWAIPPSRNTFTAVPALPGGKVAKQVIAGNFHTMILAEDGMVLACGDNEYGQLGLGDTTHRNTFTAVPALPDGKVAKQVIAGTYHTMILAEDGMVFACGWNVCGQLGLGDTTHKTPSPRCLPSRAARSPSR